jgi:PHO85 cyclin-6/7
MGSLVISPVVSDIGQYTHHPRMVGADSQQNVASGPSSRNPAYCTSPSHASRPSDTPAARPPANRAVSDQSSRNATPVAPCQPSVQGSVASSQAMNSTTSPSQVARAHPSLHVNQHSRGFDQSGFPLSSAPRGLASSSPSSPRLKPTYRSTRSLGGSEATSPSRIKIRDLSHIQSFASEELLSRPRWPHRTVSGFSDSGRQYEISAMPVSDIIEMVAGLLTKITATNDGQYDHLHRPLPHTEDGSSSLSTQTTSVLAFHGKNVPTITILSYLSRIHKYCPTTYEVFLSLLVYFDRMTEVVNRGFLQSMRRDAAQIPASPVGSPQAISPTGMSVDTPASRTSQVAEATPPPSGSIAPEDPPQHPTSMSGSASLPSAHGDLSQFFVVDSYNIHRLVIAGVTCASKFFSDVFYTNSRYAKVSQPRMAACSQLTCGIGGWTSPCRVESSGITVSPSERFSIVHPGGRARSIRDHAGRILRSRSSGPATACGSTARSTVCQQPRRRRRSLHAW